MRVEEAGLTSLVSEPWKEWELRKLDLPHWSQSRGRSESYRRWSYLTGLRAVEGVRVEEAGLTSLVSEP